MFFIIRPKEGTFSNQTTRTQSFLPMEGSTRSMCMDNLDGTHYTQSGASDAYEAHRSPACCVKNHSHLRFEFFPRTLRSVCLCRPPWASYDWCVLMGQRAWRCRFVTTAVSFSFFFSMMHVTKKNLSFGQLCWKGFFFSFQILVGTGGVGKSALVRFQFLVSIINEESESSSRSALPWVSLWRNTIQQSVL